MFEQLADPSLLDRCERVPVEATAEQLVEVLHRVELLVVATDAVGIGGEVEFLAVILVDLAPGVVDCGLGVDDEAVEVEDQGL